LADTFDTDRKRHAARVLKPLIVAEDPTRG